MSINVNISMVDEKRSFIMAEFAAPPAAIV
jgi:hypothetical protein